MRGKGVGLTWPVMNRTTILKGLAICSSIALAGGFVVYRQKQAADPRKEEEPILQGSRSKVILPSSKNIDAILANPGQQRTSEVFILPADPDSPDMKTAPPEKPETKTLLPSSKSIDYILLNPSRQNTSPPAVNPKEPEGKAPLPSSKIGAIFKPEDVPVDDDEEPDPDTEQKDKP